MTFRSGNPEPAPKGGVISDAPCFMVAAKAGAKGRSPKALFWPLEQLPTHLRVERSGLPGLAQKRRIDATKAPAAPLKGTTAMCQTSTCEA